MPLTLRGGTKKLILKGPLILQDGIPPQGNYQIIEIADYDYLTPDDPYHNYETGYFPGYSTVDSQGNFFSGGSYASDAANDLGQGLQSYITKIDKEGNVLWTKVYGIVDYIPFTPGATLDELDYSQVDNIIPRPGGGCYAAMTFDWDTSELREVVTVIVEIDTNGAVVNSVTLNQTEDPDFLGFFSTGVTALADGSLLATSLSFGDYVSIYKLTSDLDLVWTKRTPGDRINVYGSPDGGFLAVIGSFTTISGYPDYSSTVRYKFIKYDSSATEEWVKTFSTTVNSYVYKVDNPASIPFFSNGDFVFFLDRSGYLVKVSSAGNLLWERKIEWSSIPSGADSAEIISTTPPVIDNNGNVYLHCGAQVVSGFDYHYYTVVSKLNSSGDLVFTKFIKRIDSFVEIDGDTGYGVYGLQHSYYAPGTPLSVNYDGQLCLSMYSEYYYYSTTASTNGFFAVNIIASSGTFAVNGVYGDFEVSEYPEFTVSSSNDIAVSTDTGISYEARSANARPDLVSILGAPSAPVQSIITRTPLTV